MGGDASRVGDLGHIREKSNSGPSPIVQPEGVEVDGVVERDLFAQAERPPFPYVDGLSFLPPDPALTGGTFYTQWVCNDSAIGSPVKVTFSSACAITLGAAALPGPRLGTTLWKYGASGTVTESGITAGAEYVAVTRFTGSLR